MLFVTKVLATILLAAVVAEAQTFDASAFCFQCADRRNVKDTYGSPTNCHQFIKCFYFNSTFALGITETCPVGTFWHDEVLSCLPEGPTPCSDNCQNDAVAAVGCYANPASCVSYFVCANTASYPFCCPAGTRFNASACSCAADETCTDACPAVAPPASTPPTPTPQQVPSGCIDAFGNLLEPVAGRPDLFVLTPPSDPTAGAVIACAPGTNFNLSSCRCDILVPVLNPGNANECLLWLPFNGNANDQSVYKFVTNLLGSSFVDTSAGSDATNAAGSGSLNVNGGRLEIPGLKTVDMGHEASWCAWFRCGGPGNSCTSSGGVLSNNADSSATDFTVIIAAQSSNNVLYRLQFTAPIGSATATAGVNNGWNQVCVVYDGAAKTSTLYLNNVAVNTQAGAGTTRISHCPYTVGDDQFYGNFNGNIDDVLICPHALSAAEVNAHFTGDFAFLQSVGDIPA